MVGHLDGSGALPVDLPLVGSPRAGNEAQLEVGDVVISLRGATNYAAVVGSEDVKKGPLFATLDLAVLRVTGPDIEPQYLATFVNLPSTQRALSGHRSGTAALRLPLPPLRDLLVPIPPFARQQAIVSLAEASAKERQLSVSIIELRTKLINELLREVAGERPAWGNQKQ
jgi:restriction endonuclease S subunit